MTTKAVGRLTTDDSGSAGAEVDQTRSCAAPALETVNECEPERLLLDYSDGVEAESRCCNAIRVDVEHESRFENLRRAARATA